MSRKALLIEDDEDHLQRLEMLLECGGFEVRSARTVQVGITMLMEAPGHRVKLEEFITTFQVKRKNLVDY